MAEKVGGCCVCSLENDRDYNRLFYCNEPACNVAVHRACYGIPDIPTGNWLCAKCDSKESPSLIKCELCPNRDGALKKTNSEGWAHVVCALYIPEITFGNVTTMEPILILHSDLKNRMNKKCYLCEEAEETSTRATDGMCMKCSKQDCSKYFHATCAQREGLLCDKYGKNGLNYCGYCSNHIKLIKKNKNIKKIPPYQAVPKNVQQKDGRSEATSTVAASKTDQGSSHNASEGPTNSVKALVRKGSPPRFGRLKKSASTTTAFVPTNATSTSTPTTLNVEPELNSTDESPHFSLNSSMTSWSDPRRKFKKGNYNLNTTELNHVGVDADTTSDTAISPSITEENKVADASSDHLSASHVVLDPYPLPISDASISQPQGQISVNVTTAEVEDCNAGQRG